MSASQWPRQKPTAGGAPAGLTLSQLAKQIEGVVRCQLPERYSVVAEVTQFKPPGASGYAFLNLVEQHAGRVVAKMGCFIAPSAYHRIAREFDNAGIALPQPGMKVLVEGRVQFHSQYGIQLSLEGIDPSYILGERERRKRQLITRLEREGLIELNKERRFPLVPQHVAVVSSGSAAGYGDFVSQLESDFCEWRFTHCLFDTLVQGDRAEASLVSAFRQVRALAALFDVVVLIRGGGASTDLDCFDSYAVACEIARCPLPVVTGIGHERDETVADLVAHRSVKTPTAAAGLLVAALQAYEDRLNAAGQGLELGVSAALSQGQVALNQIAARLSIAVRQRLGAESDEIDTAVHGLERATHTFLGDRRQELEAVSREFLYLPQRRLSACEQEVALLQRDLECWTTALLEREQERLERHADAVNLCDPEAVLRRGYSITSKNGKPVKSTSSLRVGDRIETRLLQGSIVSTVQEG